MNESAITLVPVLLWGIVLGVIYFSGLWFSVQRLPRVSQPALWMVLSFVLRNLVALIGFYWIADGQWQRIILCLTGFLFLRVVVVKIVKNKIPPVGVTGVEN